MTNLDKKLANIEAHDKAGLRIARNLLVTQVRLNPSSAKGVADTVKDFTKLAIIEDGQFKPPNEYVVELIDRQRDIYEDLADEIRGLGSTSVLREP